MSLITSQMKCRGLSRLSKSEFPCKGRNEGFIHIKIYHVPRDETLEECCDGGLSSCRVMFTSLVTWIPGDLDPELGKCRLTDTSDGIIS